MKTLVPVVVGLVLSTGCTKELEEALDSETERSEAADADLEARVASLETKLADAESALAAAVAEVEAAAGGIAGLQGDVASLDAEAAALGSNIDSLQQDLVALEGRADVAEADLDAVADLAIRNSHSYVALDASGAWLGPVVDERIGSTTFLDVNGSGLLVEVFELDAYAFDWTTYLQSERLYYLTSNCTGTPYSLGDVSNPRMGVLEQNTGKVFGPAGDGNWVEVTVKAGKGLWEGATCEPYEPGDYQVIEFEEKGEIDGSVPVGFGFSLPQ